ncbi:MAG: polysaccharide pyruvyl transferase CsaB [Defluviitaleaceae bacterium]|nr:polysaccharide pyruvyl transferase CsaB [Defluviitaleaceae bacterium]
MSDFRGTKVLMALMGMEIGGAETHVLELCKALKKQGLDVYVMSNGGVYESELLAAGIQHFKAPLHNKKLRNLVASYLGLKRVIVDHDIKLVHAHARIPAFLCGLLQKKLHFTFVTTAHAMFNNAHIYRILTNFGDASIAIADDIKQNLLENYRMPSDKVFLTVNGINTETFGDKDVDCSGVLREFDLETYHKKIVNVSRMDKDMSHAAHRLIEIAPEMYQKNPNSRIIIVGDGNDFEAVKAKAAVANTTIGTQYIVVTGTRTDVPKFLAAADVFVGVSRSALEAMACGKPVILSGGQGHQGVFEPATLAAAVANNFTCRGTAPVTMEGLKRDVFALMDASDDKLAELAKFGRKMVADNYSIEKMATDTLGLYTAVRKCPRPINALVSGYYGSNNHGDDALLRSIVEDLREIEPKIRITAISKRPKETQEIYEVDTLHRFNFVKIRKALKRTNTLIMGGGSLIQDLTSTRSLAYYTFVMNQAHKRRAKIMLYANGIGPLVSEKSKRRAVAALENVENITLRDTQSLMTLHELGLKNDAISVTADAAFGFRQADFEGGRALLDKIQLTGKKYFCVSIRSWRTLKDDFIGEMSVFCDFMVEKYGLHPLFIPMQPSNDAEISTKILERVRQKGYFIEEEFSIEEILAIISGGEFLIGMRLHSIIYGANAGVPLIGLVYDPKVAAMMDVLGQKHYLDLDEISAMMLVGLCEQVMKRRDEIVAELADKTEQLAQEAAKNAVIAHNIIDRDLF